MRFIIPLFLLIAIGCGDNPQGPSVQGGQPGTVDDRSPAQRPAPASKKLSIRLKTNTKSPSPSLFISVEVPLDLQDPMMPIVSGVKNLTSPKNRPHVSLVHVTPKPDVARQSIVDANELIKIDVQDSIALFVENESQIQFIPAEAKQFINRPKYVVLVPDTASSTQLKRLQEVVYNATVQSITARNLDQTVFINSQLYAPAAYEPHVTVHSTGQGPTLTPIQLNRVESDVNDRLLHLANGGRPFVLPLVDVVIAERR